MATQGTCAGLKKSTTSRAVFNVDINKSMKTNATKTPKKGFTLIELLVVIAIIGVLSSVVLVSLDVARERAKATTAQAELTNVRTGIIMLVNDTGKGPGGCKYGTPGDPEVLLNDRQSGLIERPVPGITPGYDGGTGGVACEWTAQDVAKWNGPYIDISEDPWDTPYIFDPDYFPYQNCSDPDKTELPVVQAVVSGGPDLDRRYTCDDIWLEL